MEGTFCGQNVTDPGGTDNCPLGWYCSRGVAVPLPSPPGHYVGDSGAMYPAKCQPGRYADGWAFVKCKDCPAGSQCPTDGTEYPKPCPAGTYRDNVGDALDNVFCRPCPQGTWSEVEEVTYVVPEMKHVMMYSVGTELLVDICVVWGEGVCQRVGTPGSCQGCQCRVGTR